MKTEKQTEMETEMEIALNPWPAPKMLVLTLGDIHQKRARR